MIYQVINKARAARAFFDVNKQEVVLRPGELRRVNVDDGTLTRLLACSDYDVLTDPLTAVTKTPPAVTKTPIAVTGHYGIGDNLHQRAVMRELMRDYEVWLHTCHFNLFHDLVAQGLKLIMRPTALHAQARTIAREQHLFAEAKFPPLPPHAKKANIGYPAVLVNQHGSILEAMFSCVGLKMPERPDFSLPIKPEWGDAARARIAQWKPDKPLLIHRPIVVRQEWDGRSRNPDVRAYDELYRSIRDQFFVVSIADLAPGQLGRGLRLVDMLSKAGQRLAEVGGQNREPDYEV